METEGGSHNEVAKPKQGKRGISSSSSRSDCLYGVLMRLAQIYGHAILLRFLPPTRPQVRGPSHNSSSPLTLYLLILCFILKCVIELLAIVSNYMLCINNANRY